MILCCGEALIDFVPTSNQEAFQPYPGGSILNIAVGLGRMEVPVGFLSRLSTDFFGDLLAKHLIINHVNLRFCPRIDGQTTLAFVSINHHDKQQEPEYAFYANGTVDRELKKEDLPPNLDKRITVLHFGSISLVLEPGASTFESLMQREKDQRIITLDPNVRPIVIKDWDAYRNRFKRWLNYIDILRLSQVDLELLYPNEDINQLIPGWYSKGIKLIILTRGPLGSIAYLPNGNSISVPAYPVDILDTIGAGDSFFAGILTFLYEKGYLSSKTAINALPIEDLTACLEFASIAAAINCSRQGANPAYRWEIETFIQKH